MNNVRPHDETPISDEEMRAGAKDMREMLPGVGCGCLVFLVGMVASSELFVYLDGMNSHRDGIWASTVYVCAVELFTVYIMPKEWLRMKNNQDERSHSLLSISAFLLMNGFAMLPLSLPIAICSDTTWREVGEHVATTAYYSPLVWCMLAIAIGFGLRRTSRAVLMVCAPGVVALVAVGAIVAANLYPMTGTNQEDWMLLYSPTASALLRNWLIVSIPVAGFILLMIYRGLRVGATEKRPRM